MPSSKAVRGVLLGTVIGLALAGLFIVWSGKDTYIKYESGHLGSYVNGKLLWFGDRDITSLKTSTENDKDERKELETQRTTGETESDDQEPVSTEDLYKAYGHVNTIVFFIGYPRSRHSLLGSLLDAHPHMVVSDEKMAFTIWKRRSDSFIKSSIYKFYDIMFKASERSAAQGKRSRAFEGNVTNKSSRYGYLVPNQWQGRFDQYIEVIGDKAGASTAQAMLKDDAIDAVHLLEKAAAAKVKFIHVVRNPFDNIATMVIQHKTVKGRDGEHHKQIDAPEILEDKIDSYFKWAKGSNIAREALPGSVLDIPSIDVVLRPAEVLIKICKFLEIICTEKYLHDCADTVDSTPSITRNYIKWTAKQKDTVYREMNRFSFLQGYSFDKTV
ncbi:uncharacterized protein LOC111325076 isoform X1 [Stylophora pistillata]|uniref:Protein-tyrosine sulfotransferase n=1 Tax=Stylophora pistillata TaxID=50429 RepID=A0A2B4SL89_STYPI|nr:uncharacterized protein LOC111325076 isoform X1 [Stylophora pistillata]XP_022784533.1 uncharacterized protein LOC111325076 isoform X1 [Stylophora pistillata]XP_022784534.1 uncharacterized protein LOC111325076 isoform X1 [Stylophora pistillata]XP_022784535.1 uncharacterized protein LOC111325076 isoform X1 [Stylophora pistillata]XP_022784536.1 uncharacterized protein LOC111325076 isoform X1 [Stylophora pistillata]PFX29252.1 hypothetical protein AWC38_SpisGene5963 [Stylophora pistillata]